MRTSPAFADREAAVRLAQGFDLFRFGVKMMRENLRRRYPVETSEEIERRLSAWLLKPDEEPVASKS